MRDDVKKILYSTSEVLNIPVDDILGKKRDATIARARGIFLYLCTEELNLGYSELGRMFNLNHASVLHYHKKIKINNLHQQAIKIIKDLIYKDMNAIDRLLMIVDDLERRVAFLETKKEKIEVKPVKKKLSEKEINIEYDTLMRQFMTHKDEEDRKKICVKMYNLGRDMKKYNEEKAQMILNNATSTAKLLGFELLDELRKQS